MIDVEDLERSATVLELKEAAAEKLGGDASAAGLRLIYKARSALSVSS